MTELFNVKELAALLRLSPRQIWKLNSAATIPSPVRLSRSVRWRSTDIERWIELGCPVRSDFEKMRDEEALR